jgi:type I restriction enzyme S subunit
MITDKPFPANWKTKRLKYLATYNDEVLPETTDDDREIDYVEISGVSLTKGIEQIERMPFYQAPSRARRKVKAGDILVSTVRTYLKAIATVGDSGRDGLIASTGFCVIRPGDEMESDYLGWVAKSEPFVGEVVARSVGVSYPAINASDLVDIGIPIPPIEVQQRIARFLDEKTAQIDALIEKKRALLEGLAEQRQALITRAVTKGLNPDVPMKPSGVAWLGIIPAHWAERRLRFSVQKIVQGWSPQCESRPAEIGEWGVLKVGCVNGDRYDESENKALPSDVEPIKAYEVRIGDLLVSRANTKELLGSAAIVENTQGNILLCDKLYRIELDASVDSMYLTAFLRTPLARFEYEREATGTSGSMQNIGQDTLKNLRHPLPPIDEQRSIGIWVSNALSRFKTSEDAVLNAISALTEHRVALITSAITGQLPELNG